MSLGICLTNDMLLQTGLRMTYRDADAQIQTARQDLLTRIRLPDRERGIWRDPHSAALLVPRRSIGYYELTSQEGRPVKLETLIVNEMAKLRKTVESEIGTRFGSCCAAVPPCFFDMQRSALREAVQQCGIAEVMLINEPVALLKTCREDGKYLVACLEDGLFYISLLARSEDNVVELATGGDPKWGGMELVEALAQQTVRQRSGGGLKVSNEEWKQGFDSAYLLLSRLIETQRLPAESQPFLSEYVQVTQQKIANEIERVLEISRQRVSEITHCLLLGAYWRLPEMKRALDALGGVPSERVGADRIAQGTLLVSEERAADAEAVRAPAKDADRRLWRP
jgi:hypothetical protein